MEQQFQSRKTEAMAPISSGDSEFGRDEELEVDHHLKVSKANFYEKGMATTKKRDKNPIVWPTGS